MSLRFKIKNLVFLICFISIQIPINFLKAEIKNNNLLDQNQFINKEKLNDDKYLLGTGDILKIAVQGAPEFSGEFQILNDGSIVFPLIGSVFIDGNEIESAKRIISDRLSAELIYPVIFISIIKTRPINYSIIGEVKRPGIYQFRDNKTDPEFPTLIDAIRKSGGITEKANLKEVILIRRMPRPNKDKKLTKLNLIDLILEGAHNQNPYLFDGDVIKITQVNESLEKVNSLEIASANLSPKSISVSVIGEVNKPGTLEVRSNTSLTQAVLMAGGPISWKSNRGNVDLLRINPNGSARLSKYKLDLKSEISKDKNPALLDGDIIKVNKSLIGNLGSGLGVISAPLRDFVSMYTLFKIIDD